MYMILAILSGDFSIGKVIGGILVLAGLICNSKS
jgi:hypothetical protein